MMKNIWSDARKQALGLLGNRWQHMVLLMLVGVMCQATWAADPSSVKGRVQSQTTGTAVGFAAVSLYQQGTNKMIDGALADSAGVFVIGHVPTGDYYLKCNAMGFKEYQGKGFVARDGSFDVGTIMLVEDTKLLNEVVVRGHQSAYVQKIDRRVFQVGQDLTASSGSISDLLQKIPSVDVDLDGNVSLRGNDNVTILVDGRPSALFKSKNVGDALQQLSASNIERIEVITNPSAEFKPDGIGGIINIVTKKNKKEGWNGTLAANVGNRGRYNLNGSFNYRTGIANFYGSYAYKKDRYDRTTDDSRVNGDSIYHQRQLGIGHPYSHTGTLGVTLDFTKHDHLDLSGMASTRHFLRTEDIEAQTQGGGMATVGGYQRRRNADATENAWEVSGAYGHEYGDGNEWGAEYSYSSQEENEQNRYLTLMSGDSTATREQQRVWDTEYLHHAKIYVKQHSGDHLALAAGYDWENEHRDQNYATEVWDGTGYVANAQRTSDFSNYRDIHALYATLEMKFGRWNVMTGLRAELARDRQRLWLVDSTMTERRTGLYPTLNMVYDLGGQQRLTLGYSLRVNRPDGDWLNPYPEYINPLSLKAGNPHLRPEKIHSVELGWLWNNEKATTLSATLYYRYLTNKITPVTRAVGDGALLTTYDNLNDSRQAGMELLWTQGMGKWLNFNASLNGFYNQIDASRLGYGSRKNVLSWTGMFNANVIPVSNLTLQLNAKYRGRQLVAQGRQNSNFIFNLGARYAVPGTGLSVLLTVSDLFDTSRRSYTLDTPELKQKVEMRRNPRIIYLGMSYNFGYTKKKKEAKIEYDEGL